MTDALELTRRSLLASFATLAMAAPVLPVQALAQAAGVVKAARAKVIADSLEGFMSTPMRDKMMARIMIHWGDQAMIKAWIQPADPNAKPACSRSGWKWILGKRSCARRTSYGLVHK